MRVGRWWPLARKRKELALSKGLVSQLEDDISDQEEQRTLKGG